MLSIAGTIFVCLALFLSPSTSLALTIDAFEEGDFLLTAGTPTFEDAGFQDGISVVGGHRLVRAHCPGNPAREHGDREPQHQPGR